MLQYPSMTEGHDDVALSIKGPQGTRHGQETLRSPTRLCQERVCVWSPEEPRPCTLAISLSFTALRHCSWDAAARKLGDE